MNLKEAMRHSLLEAKCKIASFEHCSWSFKYLIETQLEIEESRGKLEC